MAEELRRLDLATLTTLAALVLLARRRVELGESTRVYNEEPGDA